MSVDPELALQKAVVAALRAAVTAAGNSVYDRVPPPAPGPFPRITIGPVQALPVRADCYDGTETNLQVDVWSQAVGFPEVKLIAGQVREALDDVDLVVDGHTVDLLNWQSSIAVNDPDGLTKHVIVNFQVVSHPAAGADALLMENGSYLLTESGDHILLE